MLIDIKPDYLCNKAENRSLCCRIREPHGLKKKIHREKAKERKKSGKYWILEAQEISLCD